MIRCAGRVRANRPARKHKIAIRTIAKIASVVAPETNLSGMIVAIGFNPRRARSNALPRMKASTTIGVRKSTPPRTVIRRKWEIAFISSSDCRPIAELLGHYRPLGRVAIWRACAEAHPWRPHEFDPSQAGGFA